MDHDSLITSEMSEIFTYSRSIIILLFPFVVLHYYSAHYYHLPLWSVVKWWGLNITKVNNAFPLFLGLFFTLLVNYLSVSGLVNILSLSISSEQQDLVYLGHMNENKAAYYDNDDLSKQVITGYDTEKVYNFSFNDLYRSQTFLKDEGSEGVGTKANRLHILSFVSSIIGVIAFTLTTIIIFNVFIHTAYTANPTDVILPTKDALSSFDTIALNFNFTRGGYFLLMGGLILTWLGFSMATPKNNISEPLFNLPAYITTNKTITGIPNEIHIRYVKERRTTDSNSYDTVDSGERYVNFEFTKGFNHTVYVTTLIDLDTHANQLEEINRNISSNNAMTLSLDKDLHISIPIISN
ncbi:MAG: hypothetical protein DIZ80_06865 [endosymbiont of Galathealinum brachiosum]|uniref:Uncharacterized protein n=1 Tax=endosymbiont of Galathealinum brachiosum TaxID=2200906 RepID=A0A370DH29_9GAMM|nr:MAG: hypothetical protein DIZ80_06865 [endosymbiont of Galathealinum brachiosum]